MTIRKKGVEFLLFLTACTPPPPSCWVYQHIEAGNSFFDSSCLKFFPSHPDSPLYFELRKMGPIVEGFLSLRRFRFHSPLTLSFTIDQEHFSAPVSLHEGAMRVKLSKETTEKWIEALQKELSIAIVIDGFEETLDPSDFAPSFFLFQEGGSFLENLLQG